MIGRNSRLGGLRLLFGGVLALIPLAHPHFSRAADEGFQALPSSQDRFQILESTEDWMRIRAEFVAVRDNVLALALAIPEEADFEWTLSEGVAVNTRNRRETIKIDGADLGLPENLVQSKRMWLGEVPLLTLRFLGIEQFQPTRYDGPREDRFYLQSAVLTLRFSLPIFETPRSDEAAANPDATDPFVRIASDLVLNPTAILQFRGTPRSFGKGETGGIPTKLPGNEQAPTWKIETAGNGVCILPFNHCFDAGEFRRGIPIDHLHLFGRGSRIPFFLESSRPGTIAEGDAIWFIDPAVENDQSDKNVYFLKVDSTLGPPPIVEMDGVFPEEAPEFVSHATREWDYRIERFEVDDPALYEFVGDAGDVELFWTRLGEAPFHIDFDLDGWIAGESAETASSVLRVRFDPRKPQSVTPRIIVNGKVAADSGVLRIEGDGTASVTFPTRYLLARGNRVTLEMLEAPARPVAQTPLLDWLEILHPAKPGPLPAVMDLGSDPDLPADAASGVWVEVPVSIFGQDGTVNHRLVELDDGGVPIRSRLLAPTEDGRVRIPAKGGTPRFQLVDLSRAEPPVGTKRMEGPTIFDRLTGQADRIVIAAPQYFPLLRDYLAEANEKSGVRSILASPEEIYDGFSHGEKDFRALKSFLVHAVRSLPEPRPRHLWLVGDSRWDPRNRLGLDLVDEVPTPPLETEIGLAGDDQWYAQLFGEDDLPDLLVGRTSVSTVDELSNYLEKARTWRTRRPLGWWRATALELADRDFFASVEDMFRRGLVRNFFPQSIHLSDFPMDTLRKFEAIGRAGVEGRGARDEVVRRWNQGAQWVEYLGHGGITVWSKQAMFMGLNRADSDVDRLAETDRFPFVYIRSCLSGTVNWPIPPGEVSVSEALIRAPRRGAAMVLAAVGTEQQPDQEQYARHFHRGWSDLGLRSPAVLRLYAHCRTLLQSETYLSVCRQFILHGDPTLELDAPEKLPEIRFETRGTRLRPTLTVMGRTDFSGKAQLRLHNVKQTLFESEAFQVDAGDFRREWTFDLPLVEIGEVAACVYLWNESKHRDAFGADWVELPEDRPDRIEIPLVRRPEGEVGGPFSGGLLTLQSTTPHAGIAHRAILRLEAAEDLDEPVGYNLGIEGSPKRQGVVPPGGFAIELFSFSFDRPGVHALDFVFSASDVAQGNWKQSYQASVHLLDPPQVLLASPEMDPETPVAGETIDLRTNASVVGSTTAAVVSIEASLEKVGSRLEPTRVHLHRADDYSLPLALPPGRNLPLAWRLPNDLPTGEWLFRAYFAHDEIVEATRIFHILPPPEVYTVEIVGPDNSSPIDVGDPIPLTVVTSNRGGIRSDPLVLVGADAHSEAVFQGSVPPLEPGEEAAVEVQVDSPASLFEWITTYRQQPEAITSRTRTGSQKFDLEAARSTGLGSDSDGDGKAIWKAESRRGFSTARIRYFEPTDAGLRSTDASRLYDFNPGMLEFPDTTNVLSATQPALAALENPGVWWVTPTRIETSPTAPAEPLQVLMPWKEPGAVGKISPKFVKTPSYLGYPTPFVLLESDEIRFDLNFSTVGYEGILPPQTVEVSPPGLEWTLHNRVGGWPTFSGFLFMALPEIRTPILRLDGPGPWSIRMEMEWIEAPPVGPVVEVRRKTSGGPWSGWELIADSAVEGDRFIVRAILDTGDSNSNFSIRSVEVTFTKD